LKKWLERDGFKFEDGRLIAIGRSIDLSSITATAAALDIPEMYNQIRRIEDSIEDDPALAIGTAKELVETTCKTILDARKVPYPPDEKLPALVKVTRECLNLMPDQIGDNVPGADSVRQILGALGNIPHKLAELRRDYGTGHGKSGKAKGLGARHARLAVGAAATVALFLMETHKERP
jgi:hypothetical protein